MVSWSYNHCYIHQWSSEKWQIHTQWWYFSRLLVTVDSFDTKVWSVDQWKLVLAKSLFCSILYFEISCCIFEFCPYFRPYDAWIFTKMSPYEELVALHCCFYLHSRASCGTLAHIAHLRHFCILCTHPKSCFGGLNERWAATLLLPKQQQIIFLNCTI